MSIAGKLGAFYKAGTPDEQIGGCYNWTLDTTMDTTETTTFASGGFKEYISTLAGFTISAENYWGNEDFFESLGEEILVKLFVDEEFYYGYAKITSDSIETAVDTVINETIELTGEGEIKYSGGLDSFTAKTTAENFEMSILAENDGLCFVNWGDSTRGTYELDSSTIISNTYDAGECVLNGKAYRITNLVLENVFLTELDVSGLTSLIDLSCANNSLSELDVSGLENLYFLHCEYNNLNTAALDKILDDLPDRTEKTQGICWITGEGNGIPTPGKVSAAEAKNWMVIANE